MSRLSRRSFVVAGGIALATPRSLLAAPEPPNPLSMASALAPTDTDAYKFSLVGATDSPIVGGLVHRANKTSFPVLRGVASFSLQLDPGAIRQPHLHTNANEISYCVAGQARVGLLGPAGERHLFEIAAGEVAYQPAGWVHWIENIGDGPLSALFMYSHEQPETIDVPDVLPALPPPRP